MPKEQTRRQGTEVILPTHLAAPNENITSPGSECLWQGDRILAADMSSDSAGHWGTGFLRQTIGAGDPRPRLGIITTGGELAGEGTALQPGLIRDSNGPSFAAMAQELGIDSPRYLHAGDDLNELRHALERLADAEIVVLTGGVSVGPTISCRKRRTSAAPSRCTTGSNRSRASPFYLPGPAGRSFSVCPEIHLPATWVFTATFPPRYAR